MRIQRYGIELVSLDVVHLEMVRKWRNSDFVKQFMFSSHDISEQEQLSWFDGLKNKQEYHFIIYENKVPMGSCNLKVLSNGNAEGGIYVSSPEFLNTLAPIKSMFLLYNFAFEQLGIALVEARIKRNNKRAIRFNNGLGFTFINSKISEHLYGSLDFNSFQRSLNRYKTILERDE